MENHRRCNLRHCLPATRIVYNGAIHFSYGRAYELLSLGFVFFFSPFFFFLSLSPFFRFSSHIDEIRTMVYVFAYTLRCFVLDRFLKKEKYFRIYYVRKDSIQDISSRILQKSLNLLSIHI